MSFYNRDSVLDEQVRLARFLLSDLVYVDANDALLVAISGDKRNYPTIKINSDTYIAITNTDSERERFRFLYSSIGNWKFETTRVIANISYRMQKNSNSLERGRSG